MREDDMNERFEKETGPSLQAENEALQKRVDELETELNAAYADLARAARLKDEFLASISHELRTPLNSILGLSESLVEEVYGSLSERQIKPLRIVERSGRQLLTLINSILELIRMEAGKVALNIASCDVAFACHSSIQAVSEEARAKHIKLTLTLDPSVTMLMVDERRLKQILINLLTNGVKFTSEGGEVRLEVSSNASQQTVFFTVSDTGIGIAHEDMSRLFQPFVQIDGSLSRQYAGAGLGLVLSHRLARLLSGSIKLQSEVGQGSQFTLAIPKNHEQYPSGYDPAAALDGLPDMLKALPPSLILMIEDHRACIERMQHLLLANGFRFVAAWNWIEAVERIYQDHPRLVLLNRHPPDIDGLEAIRRIRSIPSLANTPIIVETTVVLPDDESRCREAGATDYLCWPLTPGKLLPIIASCLKQEHPIPTL